MMRRFMAALLMACLLLPAAAAGEAQEAARKVVYLTFDDGPKKDTPELLALLKETYGEPDTSQSNQVLNCTTQSNRWIVEGEDYFTSLTCSVSFNPAEGKKTPYSFAIGLMYNQWTDVEGNPYPEK